MNLPDGPALHPAPVVLSVNVGSVQELKWRGDTIRTAIGKRPVSGPVTLRGVNLVGDDQANRKVHGGPDKAVYAYAMEDYDFWAAKEKFTIHPALFGENLTTQGLDVAGAVIGERWQIGTALLEVAQPRLPCATLAMRVGDPEFPKRFQSALRMGAYLRIIEEGVLEAGDSIRIVERPTHGVTIRLLAECVTDPSKLGAILAAPRLPANWRERAQNKSL